MWVRNELLNVSGAAQVEGGCSDDLNPSSFIGFAMLFEIMQWLNHDAHV